MNIVSNSLEMAMTCTHPQTNCSFWASKMSKIQLARPFVIYQFLHDGVTTLDQKPNLDVAC